MDVGVVHLGPVVLCLVILVQKNNGNVIHNQNFLPSERFPKSSVLFCCFIP